MVKDLLQGFISQQWVKWLYGCYIKGEIWHFMMLQERAYCISNGYVATRDDLFEIFRILKTLKQLITGFVGSNSQ